MLDLLNTLRRLDGQDYGACQRLKGSYSFDGFELIIERVPKDPYAPPHTGVYRIRMASPFTPINDLIFRSQSAHTAFCDYINRRFYQIATQLTRIRGTGYSGLITILQPGQTMRRRNAVRVTQTDIEIRFFIGLPAKGRAIQALLAESMLKSELVAIVQEVLLFRPEDRDAITSHIHTMEDADALRQLLTERGWISFLAEGSRLPRASGLSDLPLIDESVIPLESPESLRQTVELPHAGSVSGLAIPMGITLIVGGGYHGKSTLLQAIERGIWNHIPGDGREQCVTRRDAVKVRAASGRVVTDVDISLFINNLPNESDTLHFSSENASGSTSQGATISEALEIGTGALLMDEDTCATNFMMRDARMQQLVADADEPITPYIDRIRSLFTNGDVSSVLVLGGSGDYFGVADTVIQMRAYRPIDVTQAARHIHDQDPQKRQSSTTQKSMNVRERIIDPSSLAPLNPQRKLSVYVKETQRIHFGGQIIDLADVEQLCELAQTKAIAEALIRFHETADLGQPLKTNINQIIRDIQEHDLDILGDRIIGQFAEFRAHDLAAAVNRYRKLRAR